MKTLVKWAHDASDIYGVDFIKERETNLYTLDDILDTKDYPDNFEVFRVIVADGRHFQDFYRMAGEMDFLLSEKEKNHAIVIVSGKAWGADSLGEDYPELRGYFIDDHPANWDIHGKSAGYKRKVEMAESADALVAFWDGVSKGTKHMIDIAIAKGLAVRIVYY